ncbi:MAG: hypothetical protein R3E45_13110 [Rhodocyclaceae bacterium]
MSQPVPPAGAPEQSPLGKPSGYCSEYAPALLFPIDRAPKRAELGIHGVLPFVGEDLWNAYELSWLNPRGKPVVAMATFRVPATSPRLIESKSLKLYLNSFNGTCFDDAAVVRETIGRISRRRARRSRSSCTPRYAPDARTGLRRGRTDRHARHRD